MTSVDILACNIQAGGVSIAQGMIAVAIGVLLVWWIIENFDVTLEDDRDER